MPQIQSEYLFVFVVLLACAFAGGFAILPFRRSLRFGVLAAPFAGLLSVSLGVAVFYGIVGLPTQRALLVSWVACTLTTLVSLAVTRPKIPWKDLPGLIAVVLILVPAVTRFVDVASIREHGPAFHYSDATDQMGYAQAADWLRMYPYSAHPTATPQSPFNAWLTVLFQIDPRFASHFFLASIAIIRGVSAAFAYDVACAICLSAAILGVSGVFARSWGSLALLLGGLLVSHWYEDSRIGYLGKLLGYPAMLLTAGFFLALPKRITVQSILVLALLASATAIVHSAMATALFLTAICGLSLVARPMLALAGQRRAELESAWQSCLVLALLVGTAIMSSGIPARPVGIGAPDFGIKWKYIYPRTLDLEHQGANIGNVPNDHLPPLAFGRENKLVSGLTAKTIRRFARIASVMWIGFLILAIVRRDPLAVGPLLGPLLILLVFYWYDKRPEAFQLVGVIYPATLCGIAPLVIPPNFRNRKNALRYSLIVGIATIAFIGMRVPRFVGSVNRYASVHRPRSQEFTLRQTQRLVSAIGSEPVELDLPSITHLLFAMVEFNNRGLHVQFSPASFNGAFSYMGWPTPSYPPAKLRLGLASEPRPPGWRVKLRAAPFVLYELPQ